MQDFDDVVWRDADLITIPLLQRHAHVLRNLKTRGAMTAGTVGVDREEILAGVYLCDMVVILTGSVMHSIKAHFVAVVELFPSTLLQENASVIGERQDMHDVVLRFNDVPSRHPLLLHP